MEALEELGGSGSIIEVSRIIWRRHELDLRASGEIFYTWQYDLCWAGQKLRGSGRLQPSTRPKAREAWKLV